MRRARVVSILLAVAFAGPALGDPPVPTDRFMVVLKPQADVAARDALEKRLSKVYGAHTVDRSIEGALLGLLVVLDARRADGLRREESVASVVRVERPTGAPVSPPEDAFQRSPPGWAIPGLYTVVLRDRWSFGLDLPPDWDQLTRIARRTVFQERRNALLRRRADEMAAQYGGTVRDTHSFDAPTFSCAMTEEAAVRMATDERVFRVHETTYVLFDDPPVPSRSIRDPFPPPAFWRP